MAFIHISDIIELCQVEAIADKLLPTSASRWRKLCREYSSMFHTPYKDVLEMDPEFVILSVYEKELDDIDINDKLEDLMERVYTIEDPDYEVAKEKDLVDFIKDAEEEEAERVKENRPVFGKKKALLNKEEPTKEQPKGGFIDLSYLSKEEE